MQVQQRNRVSTTVMQRVYDSKGKNFIEQKWENACDNSIPGTIPSYQEFCMDIWPGLLLHRIPDDDEEEGFDPDNSPIYDQFVTLCEELRDCQIHTQLKMQEYPHVAIRLGNASLKLPLHQVPYYVETGWTTIHEEKNKSFAFAHKCHQRDCLIHAWPTSREENTSQTYCKKFQLVGTKLYDVCRCSPRCLRPGTLAFVYSK